MVYTLKPSVLFFAHPRGIYLLKQKRISLKEHLYPFNYWFALYEFTMIYISFFIFQLSTKMTRWLSFTTEFPRRVQPVSCIYLMNYAMKTNSTYFCWTFPIPIPWRSATASFLPIMFHIGTKKCQPYTMGILHILTFKIWAFKLEMSNS